MDCLFKIQSIQRLFNLKTEATNDDILTPYYQPP